MVIVSCPAPGCTYVTPDVDAAIVSSLLNIHGISHQSQTAGITRGPKLERPRIDIGVDQETWNAFCRRWEAFKNGSGINDTSAPTQLFQCASESLGDLMLKADPNITSRNTKDVLDSMRQLAVIPTAKGVLRAELMQMKQSADESFRTFAARVKGKAETCGFTVTTQCSCGETIHADYTEDASRDVLLAGIADIDIRREALSADGIQSKSTNDVIAFVESKEMARNATPVSTFSAISNFKKTMSQVPGSSEKTATIPCPDCGQRFRPFKQKNGIWNTKPHKICLECWRTKRRRPAQNKDSSKEVSTLDSHCDQITQVSAITLRHKIFSKNEWRRAKCSKHPTVEFGLGLQKPKSTRTTTVVGLADTGAQSNLWGLQDFQRAGFTIQELETVRMDIRAANKNPINIIGAFRGHFSGKAPSGQIITCLSMVYVSDSVSGFFLSYDTMVDLGIVDKCFPTIGSCAIDKTNANPERTVITNRHEQHICSNELNHTRTLNAGCMDKATSESTCSCPQRSFVPDRPTSLPFEATAENNVKMKAWLLQRYASSTFNTCPHRPLPCMTGPPIEIHIDDTATPRSCHTAAPIPLHWQQRVHEDLLRDEALGVIERVPYGEPVTWCHRMVVTRKHDGSPRRTVDLSPLNKFCKRETFATEAPFQLARRVPGNSWKTVTDAWNGYHSVPLRNSDRPLTTFITPFGRWRYTRAPQGFLSSGDGYNRRFDQILADFERKERCVDDTIHYDDELEEHWWRTIDFLSLVGRAGIVLNPDKFQFAEKEVDFAGFHISERAISPLPKYFEAIQSFPTPKSTTDIRSWFGLVNQVANYAQLRDIMVPFRPFLSPKYKFFWTPVLDKAFNESKQAIVDAIRHGVEIFDTSKPTCLRPDWSSKGIGYFLLQQHCSCTTGMPDCCQNGWKVTLAGSRFLNGAEQRYAPIEGEALAIAWGLEQTRYFTQGCPDLLIVTDHKPLTKIFGDRTLDEISNSRLFRLKQRTLPWHFRIAHSPGRTNCAADATSRHPCAISETSPEDCSESMLVATICQEVEDLSAISWSRMAQETSADTALSMLMVAISEDFVNEYPSISSFTRYKDSLYVMDGVIMYNDRVVVPSSLRQSILNGLHSAHQGVSSMELRAQSIVFWPGMTFDIHSTRAKCRECNRNAPSQGPLPSEPATPPSTPFEQIFADFFEFGGHHYLVVGDRLSGWSEIFSTPPGGHHSGARGLIACLRSFFATFGVPEEISSDGGPEFTASTTSEFFRRWGVRHRLSSAYHPQSNGRAEVAVKTAKRLLRSNIGPTGTLDNDRLLRAMLQLRNTPDPDCNVSPAQIIFGRSIRDTFSFANRLEKFSNPAIHPLWREAWASKEAALRTRFTRTSEVLNEHARSLPPLSPGDRCFIQNQTGNSPKKWDRTGLVTEVLDNDQYIVKVDGSGRVTRRNRRYLRAFKPATVASERAPPRNSVLPNTLPPGSAQHIESPVPVRNPVTSDRDHDQQVPPHPIQISDSSPCVQYPTTANSPQGLSTQNPHMTMVTSEPTTPTVSAPSPITITQGSPTTLNVPNVPIAVGVPETPTGKVASHPKLPRALQRLMPHNKPGNNESLMLQPRRKPIERP